MLRCRAKPSSVLDLDPERAGDNRRRSRKHRKEKKEKKERRDKVKNKKNKKDKKDGKERSGETRGAPAERAPAGAQGGPVARLWRPWGSRPIGALLKPAVLPPPPPSPPGGLKGISLEHFCRQYIHKGECDFGRKCKFIHSTFCRRYLLTGKECASCDFSHFDICPEFKARLPCPRRQRCPFLHVRVPAELSSGVHGVQMPSQWSPGAASVLSAPPLPANWTAPAESQLTSGFAEKYGYEEWGDSGVEEDTDGEHSSDQSSGSDLEDQQDRAQPRWAKSSGSGTAGGVVEPGKYVPRKARAKGDPAEDDGQGDQGGAECKVEKVEKVVEAKIDCRVFHKWRVSCARCHQDVMKVDNHRICHVVACEGGKKKSVCVYRALRGTWLSTKDGGLFGGGGRGGTMRPKKGKSGRVCQTRLSSAYNVAKAKDRKRERRILKGKLLKRNWKYHDLEECDPNAPEMRFEEQVRLERIIQLRGEEIKRDEADEDDKPLLQLMDKATEAKEAKEAKDEDDEDDEDDMPLRGEAQTPT